MIAMLIMAGSKDRNIRTACCPRIHPCQGNNPTEGNEDHFKQKETKGIRIAPRHACWTKRSRARWRSI